MPEVHKFPPGVNFVCPVLQADLFFCCSIKSLTIPGKCPSYKFENNLEENTPGVLFVKLRNKTVHV